MIFFPFVVELFTLSNSFIKLFFHKLCYELFELCSNTLDIFGHGLNKSGYTKFTDPIPFIFTTIDERFYRLCKSISNLIRTTIIGFKEFKSSTEEGVIELLIFSSFFCLIFISDSSRASIFYRVILNSISSKLVCSLIWSFCLAIIRNFEVFSITSFNSCCSTAVYLKIMSNSLKIRIVVL